MANNKTFFNVVEALPFLILPSGADVTYPDETFNPTENQIQVVPSQPPAQIEPVNSGPIANTGALISPFNGGSICPSGRRFATIVQDNKLKDIPHGGIDLQPKTGDIKLYACCTGTVIPPTPYDADTKTPFTGHSCLISNSTPIGGKSYGFFYLHMAQAATINGKPITSENNKVTAGDWIGNMDDTGFSFGAHLHLIVIDREAQSVDFGAFGAYPYVDPEPIFASQGITFPAS